MIACKPQKFRVSLWIVTLTEPCDTKPKKQNWDRLKMFKEMNGLRIIHSCRFECGMAAKIFEELWEMVIRKLKWKYILLVVVVKWMEM